MYVPLSNEADWDRVWRYPPNVAVLNIDNGPGTSPKDPKEVDEHWLGKAQKLRNLLVTTIGYVDVDYGRRPIADVLLDMRAWQKYKTQGWFFDRVLNDTSFVSPLAVMAREYNKAIGYPRGRNVFNLGTTPQSREWGGRVFARDLFVTFEGSAGDYLHGDAFGGGVHLVYSCPVEQAPAVFAKATELKATGIYVTPDVPPNPYDSYYPQVPLSQGVAVTW